MTGEPVLAAAVRALAAAGIPYLLTGSFAGSVHGTPRATQDIDLVISPTRPQLRMLLRAFPPDRYYAEEGSALEALDQEAQFNVIDGDTGWKVDFIIRRSRPFSLAEFDRREEVEFGGTRLFVATAEDLIVAKLEWAQLGQSARQIEDAAGILRVGPETLDRQYIAGWVAQLGLDREWALARQLAGE